MTRYLTPSKLCVLWLIDLYLAGHTALSARLSVLSFIAARVHVAGAHNANDIDQLTEALTGGASDLLEPLQQWPSDVPGRNVYDMLLQRLWRLDGLDSLHVLFDQLSERITALAASDKPRTGLSRASPLGQYIRRCCVEFTRLQFADSQALWSAFVTYRAPTYDTWAHRNPVDAAAALAEGDVLSAGLESPARHGLAQPTNTAEAYLSTDDTDTLLTFSIHQLQKLGTRLPDSVKGKLQLWMRDQWDSGVQSLQHFLAFFEHWKAGQYTMALESLHRYFDYSLVAKSGSDNMRVYYQYALLHLSVLHADFDCWEESVEAMDECIATARENQDTACLNFALSWLLYLREAKPANHYSPFGTVSGLGGAGGGEQDEIVFLKAKAKETKHWSLLSSTLLDESKLDMYRSGMTARALEHIAQSAYLNMQHDLRTLMPVANLFGGASLDRLGQAHLAVRMYEDVDATHGKQSPITDRVRASCRLAYGAAQAGQYAASLRMLGDLASSARGVLKLEQRITGFTFLAQLTRSLRQGDLRAADHYFAQLLPLRSFGDPEMDFEVGLLEIDLLLQRQEPERALKSVNAHIRRLKGIASADIAHRLHFLVLKARIFALSGQPTKCFSIALRAASTARRHTLIPVLLEALAVLAAILNDLFEFGAAREICESALPWIYETRQVKLLAQAFVTLAEAHVGAAGHACTQGSGEQAQHMRLAEAQVERSREVYAGLEDRSGMLECLIMRTQLARWRKDDASVAQADALYMQLLADSPETDTGISGH
ncbi:hypothetical protein LTR36_009061 [Oleoguttula mirabilis]|uniref:Anaphase-promoting complex subunit 5 n=1 Tax=Oleoguttula mirabilis TaxID=1507867 RepID=A0AAV9J6J6_9PEZI|nr:hypothetical protein LTR36_009061 [Oleoguttula mirabilis]